MTINHVHLAATDVAATRTFYERFFGFREESVHGTGVFLRDNARFLIALDPATERHAFPVWFHLGFCRSSESEVLALHSALQSGGATIVRKLLTEAGAFASFFVADPDGVRIEVSWHSPDAE